MGMEEGWCFEMEAELDWGFGRVGFKRVKENGILKERIF